MATAGAETCGVNLGAPEAAQDAGGFMRGKTVEEMQGQRERYKSLIMAAEYTRGEFTAGDVAGHLKISVACAQQYLHQLTVDRLLSAETRRGKNYYRREQESLLCRKWVKRDNGIRIGMYYP